MGLDSRGQNSLAMIIAIVVAGISLIIGVQVFSNVGDVTDDYNDVGYLTEDSTFSENLENSTESPWSVSDENTATTWDSTNEWAQIENAPDENLGISKVTQTLSVETNDGVTSASISTAYQAPTVDNADVTLTLNLRDPSGNVDTLNEGVLTSSTSGWTTWENNVENYVDEDGNYEIIFQTEYENNNLENSVEFEVNGDNAELDVDTQEQTEVGGIEDDLYDAYGMAPIVIIVLIASVIIGVLVDFRR